MNPKKLQKLKEIIKEEIKDILENQPIIDPGKKTKEKEKEKEKEKKRTLIPDREKTPDSIPHKAEAKNPMIDQIAKRYKNLSK